LRKALMLLLTPAFIFEGIAALLGTVITKNVLIF
jgi:hypothetical protein